LLAAVYTLDTILEKTLMEKTLMISISGIRGIFGRGLDPQVLVTYAGAFGTWCRRRALARGAEPIVGVGRDARVTGPVCASIVTGTLRSAGCQVVDAGLATTPTVEMAVLAEQGAGGIVLSASHNPAAWNALKLLNEKGEFLSPEEGQEVLRIAADGAAETVGYDAVGTYRQQDFLAYHIDRILALDFIHPGRIAARDFRVVVDAVDSVGGVAIPALLERLGVRPEQIVCLNCAPTGLFSHNPEPLPQHLGAIMARVRDEGADLGIVVDPDADRLALVEDGGRYVSEELTQVIAADFLWRFRPGPFVTNLSSSRAIDDVAARYGLPVYRAAVGEINVVKQMQAVEAVLGGEGNGGVILPELHYGRDALVGVAMVLQHLADRNAALSEVRASLPAYVISKNKAPLGDVDPDALIAAVADRYRHEQISTLDGLKIDFADGWVHLRKSNTEPILRIYAEASTAEAADALAQRFIGELKELEAAV
jgi:phosphomannomutase